MERSHVAWGVFMLVGGCEPVSGVLSCFCARSPFLAIVRSLEGSGRAVLNHGDCDSVLRLRGPLSNRGAKFAGSSTKNSEYVCHSGWWGVGTTTTNPPMGALCHVQLPVEYFIKVVYYYIMSLVSKKGAKMARADGKVNFQLSVTPEEKEMIKADAKALGMTPARYVVMVCSMVNETARETAMVDFAGRFTKMIAKSLVDGASSAMKE